MPMQQAMSAALLPASMHMMASRYQGLQLMLLNSGDPRKQYKQ